MTAGPDLVVHSDHPLNCETPVTSIRGDLVPNNRFYVRNHFGIPSADAASWQLEITGLVRRPLRVTMAGLRDLPARREVITLECAGNGRARLSPPVPGDQWDLGAASTAEWTGVPLRDVLDQAGILPGAVDVVFGGADDGPVDGRDGPVRFERSLPVAVALESGALLAYQMNGADLPAAHGYPLRLVVPGWYAVASVKWLTSIEVTSRPFDGYFQADRYHIDGTPVTLQRIRSVIVSPSGNVQAGPVIIRGVAWSGAAPIARVEVRVGAGPWRTATLAGEPRRHRWLWWHLPARLDAGPVILRARATDLAGNTQPERPPWNALGYGNNAIQQVTVQATAGQDSSVISRARAKSLPVKPPAE